MNNLVSHLESMSAGLLRELAAEFSEYVVVDPELRARKTPEEMRVIEERKAEWQAAVDDINAELARRGARRTATVKREAARRAVCDRCFCEKPASGVCGNC
ncbi:hypothetical protein [Micromonospora aurantiaca (nom. illeg.)]|uniref:hypothetical protein n=1 Tax=Micromonospora aurantiaca (nom. illeg.) TaxID=47850 RepID=UPI000827543E|nr:hypothetical protein [Micromonospora aurantiaca]SCL43378.1 hypothetical protein GA0070615_6428 [Micromonospora aurantiaca]